MTDDHRPDPDALLEAIQHQEAKQQRGKLKIFFGMSAGVGKTYAMLEASHQRLAEGVDVVIGYIETHKRAETEALVAGLPIIPRKKLEYHGSIQEEMDIDAILARKPELVLVDELAHTNVSGSRQPKRYQDVLDLLAAGIDVYTTVNVQHLESRADTVAQITGITVRETIPDTLIEIADKIELIDLEPDELLKRLAEGKVYTPDRAQLAANNFFREGNLTALREMALRLTAERVDQQMQDYMQVKAIHGPWKSLERLMVAVSPSPLSERLVRWTRRTAYTLKAPWLAVFIEPLHPLTDAQKIQLSRNLSLARKLGGEVVTTSGDNPVRELMRIAEQRNVTQIIVGKPTRSLFQEFLAGGSLVNQLVRVSGEIDVYVVTGDQTEETNRPVIVRPTLHSEPNQYILSLAVVLAAIAISYFLISPLISYHEVALVLLFVIVILANFVGRGPILMAATVSAVLWNFLFIPPRFTFFVSTLQDVLTLGLYLIIALVTGNLTARLSSQKRVVHLREDRTSALYTMARQIAEAATLDDVLRTAVEQVGGLFDADIAFLLPDAMHHLVSKPHPASTLTLDDKELSVAHWSFERGQPAGRFTDTLPTSTVQYLPLVTSGGVTGVMGVRLHHDEPPSADQEALLQTFASHIALAVERELLDERAQHAAVLAESERMYATLLDSVSHELRTPLAKIDLAATELIAPENQCNDEIQQTRGTAIKDYTVKLNGLVDNLLDMTRLEAGHLKLNLEMSDVSELVAASIKRVEKELADHDLVVDIAPDLPKVRMDFVLMEQVLVNLLDNAATYTLSGVRIRVTAQLEGHELVLSVADRGPGLPPADLDRIFDKFYRADGATLGGTGLGLSICKGFVEAHGGTITAENRPTHGGARFTIRLPINTTTVQAQMVIPRSEVARD
ncbi:MAG: sensor histidine kinase KdpD [Chloroflexota bacterium]